MNDGLFNWINTIEILNPLNIIMMQREILYVFVHGIHQSVFDVGVVQSKCMSKLMSSHQKQTVSCERKDMLANVSLSNFCSVWRRWLSLTPIRAKSPFFICVIVAGGCTPEFSITTAFTGARRVFSSKEGERKLAWLTFWISTNYSCICEGNIVL